MVTKVKICGLKTAEAVAAAVAGGADYVGFVFYEPSPRNIAPEVARALARQVRGRAQVVALFVDPDDSLLDKVVAEVNPDLIQLHGGETPERVAAIRQRCGRPVMKAVRVETRADAEVALQYLDAADLIVFDAKAPASFQELLPGGNGMAFDWRALLGIRDKVPFMLSGGLTPENVAEAIRLTTAEAVDVSSGVEVRPGEKDPERIRRFLAAVKAPVTAPANGQ
ncbi:MAG TPA: phosphoribosylanthranilate isomerase [Hyphomicrobiaceae bacterium]|jgi:phosphoribosylanthranilate isomerase|nr:phosphoribosylanthranilate isomerase [Hyphomicrobiaceae bacterium]